MIGGLRILLLIGGLALFSLFMLGQSDLKTIIIDATEDTYVVTDLSDDVDPQGFRSSNYGSLEFLKTWYAWGVLENERLLSIDLIKFDLSELRDFEIESVALQLFARQANLTQAARLIDIHVVQGAWSQHEVTFDTRPPWDQVPLATAAIYGGGGWYTWNVTGSVITGARAGEVSYAVALRSASDENEEQVLFVSTEAVERVPRLLVTYVAIPSTGVGDIDWWWWAIVGGVAVVLVMGAFFIGTRRRGGPGGSRSAPPPPVVPSI